eukprot:CAMPEP_0175068858 /NCGR_PEP_ID=MMETSP0052_2-20121109/17894_1 /TAXON_ID=51329 ORGANISM="Polytomella parva, Strain SAG 63-3" /NCGR_SAMPLE_ID=MMETSP0052_2 /ASSEMBLY_ACC=CAM_ASM_000194 /LENGTH=756 /DNA_ID=CAMNT_0016335911 /DNA_START=75 /DNA_END=2346 /DNA_ORIENTATION=+
MDSAIATLREALAQLDEVTTNLCKHKESFSDESNKHIEDLKSVSYELFEIIEQYRCFPGGLSSVLGYAFKLQDFAKIEPKFKSLLLKLTDGSILIPGSLKDDCSTAVAQCIAISLQPTGDFSIIYARFLKFVSHVLQQQGKDLDVLETELDRSVRQLLILVYGKDNLSKYEFLEECSLLKGAVSNPDACCSKELMISLNLILNSLERLHSSFLDESDDDATSSSDDSPYSGRLHLHQLSDGQSVNDDDYDDDDDDPFFMPMPKAVKWAEAEKFDTLAKPIAPMRPDAKHFVIVMDDEVEFMDFGNDGFKDGGSDDVLGDDEGDYDDDDDDDIIESDDIVPRGGAAAAAVGRSLEQGHDNDGNDDDGVLLDFIHDDAPLSGLDLDDDDGDDELEIVDDGGDDDDDDNIFADEDEDEDEDKDKDKDKDGNGAEDGHGAVAKTTPSKEKSPGTVTAEGGALLAPPAAPPAIPPLPPIVISSPSTVAKGTLRSPSTISPADANSPKGGSGSGGGVVSPPPSASSSSLPPTSIRQQRHLVPARPEEVIQKLKESKELSAVANGEVPPDKLNQFVDFLSGDHPGACMFQAQMRLSIEGCKMLSSFLKSSARVRALSLSHNLIGDDGVAVLCEGLKVNSAITALDLPDNNISDSGAIMLVEALKSNNSLTQLQLSVNKIGNPGAIAIADLLKTNISIRKLGLYNNNIGGAGCNAITEALRSNQVLKHVQILPGNPVEEKDAKALAKMLRRNNKFSIKNFLGFE